MDPRDTAWRRLGLHVVQGGQSPRQTVHHQVLHVEEETHPQPAAIQTPVRHHFYYLRYKLITLVQLVKGATDFIITLLRLALPLDNTAAH